MVATLGYEGPSRDMKKIRNERVPQRHNCFREPTFPNKVSYFPFGNEIFADGLDVCGLRRCRLVNTSDKEMADNDVAMWVAWNTAPGGKLSLFDVDKDWLPSYDIIKGRRIVCPDDEPPLLETVINGYFNGRMVELPDHHAWIRRRRPQGQDNANHPQAPL